jgi:hypothetical protein
MYVFARARVVRDLVLQITRSGRLEDLVGVPLQELAVRPVGPTRWQLDDLACLGVELLAVAELLAQPRADQEAVSGIQAQVVAVETWCAHLT